MSEAKHISEIASAVLRDIKAKAALRRQEQQRRVVGAVNDFVSSQKRPGQRRQSNRDQTEQENFFPCRKENLDKPHDTKNTD